MLVYGRGVDVFQNCAPKYFPLEICVENIFIVSYVAFLVDVTFLTFSGYQCFIGSRVINLGHIGVAFWWVFFSGCVFVLLFSVVLFVFM